MSLAVEPSPAPGEAMSASSPRPEVPFAELIAVHTRYGVVGMSMSVTPYCRTASRTAFTTAGVEAMVPASPTPLTPSGLVVDGVVVFAVSKLIRSAAEGSV